MLLNNFFKILFLFSISTFLLSCDAEKEDTNEVFTWDYTESTIGTKKITKYDSPNYKVIKSESNHIIKGYPNTQDSLEIVLGNLGGHELKIGQHKFGFGDYTSLTFFKNGTVHQAKSGILNLSYINNRMDFDFEAILPNGDFIESGFADNLLITLEKITEDTVSVVSEIGTIEATINGAQFLWQDTETEGYSNPLFMSGSNSANTINLTLNEITNVMDIKNSIGKTLSFGSLNNNITYTVGGTQTYYATSGYGVITSFKNNIITLTFNASLVNLADVTDIIPLANGKVNAMFLNKL